MFSHLPFLQYEGSWHSFTSAKGTTDTGYSMNICSGANCQTVEIIATVQLTPIVLQNIDEVCNVFFCYDCVRFNTMEMFEALHNNALYSHEAAFKKNTTWHSFTFQTSEVIYCKDIISVWMMFTVVFYCVHQLYDSYYFFMVFPKMLACKFNCFI